MLRGQRVASALQVGAGYRVVLDRVEDLGLLLHGHGVLTGGAAKRHCREDKDYAHDFAPVTMSPAPTIMR